MQDVGRKQKLANYEDVVAPPRIHVQRRASLPTLTSEDLVYRELSRLSSVLLGMDDIFYLQCDYISALASVDSSALYCKCL